MVIRLTFLGILIGCLLLIPAVYASTITWSSYTWNLNAHSQTCPGGTNCPTVRNGILDTSMANTAVSYTGTYSSNIYQGQEDWCNCVPPILYHHFFSVSGQFISLSYSSTSNDYTVETSFYVYLTIPVSGTNCGANVPSTNWLDIEIFYSGRSGTPYIGCSSAGTINYREVINQTGQGDTFRLRDFAINELVTRALIKQGLATTTQNYLSGVEIGVEGFGISNLGVVWNNATFALPPGGGGGAIPR